MFRSDANCLSFILAFSAFPPWQVGQGVLLPSQLGSTSQGEAAVDPEWSSAPTANNITPQGLSREMLIITYVDHGGFFPRFQHRRRSKECPTSSWSPHGTQVRNPMLICLDLLPDMPVWFRVGAVVGHAPLRRLSFPTGRWALSYVKIPVYDGCAFSRALRGRT